MTNSTNVQLVKWTFPAAALIIGFYWYKRRRANRADPGGTARSDYQDMISVTQKTDTKLYDSSIRETGESFSMSCYAQQEAPTRTPRKVSESMDIPVRKSSSQSFSCDSSQTLCADEEPLCSNVQLGSNPSMSYFETIAGKRNAPAFEPEFADRRVFEEDTEDVQYAVQRKVEPAERQDAAAAAAAEYSHQEDRQPTTTEQHPENETAKTQKQGAYERDSANHSPISGVLDGSIPDEVRSEGSTDSGKGGSINGCRKPNVTSTTYYFAIPQSLVGRLIGRHGSFLHSIRTTAEVQILVSDNPNASEQKICSIEGSVESINIALGMIRKKFPEKKFPQVTLAEMATSEVTSVMAASSWVPQCTQLFLVDGVNNDILVSHIVKPHWLFIQIPTHPTYPSLRLLDASMTYAYNTIDLPIPSVLASGMVYAANWYDTWVRVCMVKLDPLGEKHTMRLLDHGGYYEFHNSQIRDIRPEHLTLPFQAIEIFLANIRPKNGEWDNRALDVIARICFGVVGQAQVQGYSDTHVYTNVYFNIQKYGIISLAEELIARGFAEPVTLEDTATETVLHPFQSINYT